MRTLRHAIPGLAVALALTVLLGGPLAVDAQEAPRAGGVLKAAMIGEPPSLDLHWTTAVITQQISWHIYETLLTYDRNYTPVPLLAEGATAPTAGGGTPSPSARACGSTAARR